MPKKRKGLKRPVARITARIAKPVVITIPAARAAEIYRGFLVDANGKPLRHVFEKVIPAQSANYDKAMQVAKKAGYQLADRREGALLRASDPFGQTGWFWLSEPYEGDAGYAWAQYFSNGNQNGCLKDGEFRVRLVRTIEIQ